ncbi:hypothetical protein MHM88_07625 [Epibacterium sp. MM17-32]|nr:hypothetical protein [Epibacterium sp. MM17-32]MCG7627669.1 hypothetical protein [Epibacterium sp. MM17-32]
MRPVVLLRLAALVFTTVTCVVLGDAAGKPLTARRSNRWWWPGRVS